MTQIFEDDKVIPVTVLEAGPATVVQKKTMEKDGDQVQVVMNIEERKVNRPMKGHFREQAPRFLREFKVEDISQVEVGQSYGVELFSEEKWSRSPGPQKAKALPGSNATDLVVSLRLMDTAGIANREYRAMCLRVAFLKVRKCTANTVTRKSLPRDFRSLKSSPSKNCPHQGRGSRRQRRARYPSQNAR